MTFIRKDNEEKDRKYEKYAARREERILRTKALRGYVFRISEEKSFKPRVIVPIVFTDEDLETIKLPHVDPLVVKLRIGDAIVSRVLVNGGSSSDVIFCCTLRRMRVVEELIHLVNTHIYAFDETKIIPIDTITLPVYDVDQVLMVRFFVVDTQSTVNVIMSREWIHSVKVVVLILH